MKVLYLIQTHKEPEQIYRLAQIIIKSSPNSQVLISHDYSVCNLDTGPLGRLPGVDVIKRDAGGVRGDFSLVQAYLDAVDWLFNNKIDFDWLINLSGQDYPTQSLCKIEKLFSETQYDGFLDHAKALVADSVWGIEQSRDRYLYQYWHSNIQLSKWQRKPLRIISRFINNTQPFIKIDCFYQFSVGLRAFSNPFNQDFECYGGSFFKALSKDCVRYLHEFSKQNQNLVKYYERTCNPDESFMQTVLVNSKLFNFCGDNKYYIDFSNNKDSSSPRVLTVEDYPSLIDDNVYFARKFDAKKDSRILDMLDVRILQSS